MHATPTWFSLCLTPIYFTFAPFLKKDRQTVDRDMTTGRRDRQWDRDKTGTGTGTGVGVAGLGTDDLGLLK